MLDRNSPMPLLSLLNLFPLICDLVIMFQASKMIYKPLGMLHVAGAA